MAGVIPIIFAVSILLFPAQIADLLHRQRHRLGAERGDLDQHEPERAEQHPAVRDAVLPAGRLLHVLLHGLPVPARPDRRLPAQERRLHPGHPSGQADRAVPGRASRTGSRSAARSSSDCIAVLPFIVTGDHPGHAEPPARRDEHPDHGQRRGRDDEAARGADDDASLRGLHPMTDDVRARSSGERLIVLLVGRRRRPARAPRRRPSRASSGSRTSLRATSSVPRWRPARRSAIEARHVHGARRARARTRSRSACSWTSSPSRHAARGAILDGFPRTVAQAAGARRDARAPQGERVDRVIFIEVPTEVLVRRVGGRWVCPTCGTPYHEIADPPRVPGHLRPRGRRSSCQRDDDRPEVVRARLEQQVPPMLEVVDHYERAGHRRPGRRRSCRSRA